MPKRVGNEPEIEYFVIRGAKVEEAEVFSLSEMHRYLRVHTLAGGAGYRIPQDIFRFRPQLDNDAVDMLEARFYRRFDLFTQEVCCFQIFEVRAYRQLNEEELPRASCLQGVESLHSGHRQHDLTNLIELLKADGGVQEHLDRFLQDPVARSEDEE